MERDLNDCWARARLYWDCNMERDLNDCWARARLYCDWNRERLKRLLGSGEAVL